MFVHSRHAADPEILSHIFFARPLASLPALCYDKFVKGD